MSKVRSNLISSTTSLEYELPNDLKLRILKNQEILESPEIWVKT